MCGIAGILYFDPTRRATREELGRMVETQVHRGPDDEGYFLDGPIGMGIRRLAIIDLATGGQPISNEDGSVWVVLNGEIYNYGELRERLKRKDHIFRSRSDTEVLVHLYEEVGEEFPEHLNAMCAVALWDQRERKLLLVRDRMGVKPLYYALLPDRLVFASELKALLPSGVPREIDRQALHHYLSLGYIPAPRTIFQAVRKLEAGHVMIAQAQRCVIRKYWDLPTAEDDSVADPLFLEHSQEELRALLIDALKIRLVSDVPLGTFLSGGLDSSTIVALLRHAGGNSQKTFSVGFEKGSYNELPYARRVAQMFSTEHHEAIVRPNVKEVLPVLQYHLDEPFADPSAIPTYYLSRMARRHVTVALGGDGGDEVFAGYYTYQADRLLPLYQWIPGYLRRGPLAKLCALIPASERKVSWDFKIRRLVYGGCFPPERAHFAWKEWFSEDLMQELYAAPDPRLEPTFAVFENCYAQYRGRDPLNRHLYVDTKISLADDILVKVDRMSMATSLEVRGPFLDYRVAEFMSRLPGWMKMPGFALKHVLRCIMQNDLPVDILHSKKRGFNVPLAHWMRNDLRQVAVEVLAPAEIKKQGLFSPAVVSRLLEEQWGGRRDWSRHLWILLMFSLWYDRYARGA